MGTTPTYVTPTGTQPTTHQRHPATPQDAQPARERIRAPFSQRGAPDTREKNRKNNGHRNYTVQL